ncbi:MAG: hypothetical protein IPM91_10160 [Bacteroidetes bacterium]|nr:hypothetical protein [Bacteroidota bacterium]
MHTYAGIPSTTVQISVLQPSTVSLGNDTKGCGGISARGLCGTPAMLIGLRQWNGNRLDPTPIL